MNTFYLIVARNDNQSDINIPEFLNGNSFTAVTKPEDCMWKFQTDELPPAVLHIIYYGLYTQFSFCLIWEESFTEPRWPWAYPHDGHAQLEDYILNGMKNRTLALQELIETALCILRKKDAQASMIE